MARRSGVKIERASERENGRTERLFLAVQGMFGATRIGSRVRSIVNHGGRAEKKLPLEIVLVQLCFLSKVMYSGETVVAATAAPSFLTLYRRIVSARTHFRVVAIYKSSAFPLTSHYGT